MNRAIACAASLLLFAAAPAGAASFQIWENSLGSPGVTANFPNGTGLFADIDFDADSAEGGGLLFGASEITIVPLGALSFVSFVCEMGPPCDDGVDYSFTPGGAGTGELVVSDPNFDSPINGVFDLGTIGFDIAAGIGQIQLTDCAYTGTDEVERNCDPFTLVAVPEPGTGALLALGLGVVAWRRQR